MRGITLWTLIALGIGSVPAALAGTAGAPDPARAAASSEGRAVYFATCAGCHGDRGQGEQASGAPNIGAMQAWYVERQLHNFVAGVRGAAASDDRGARMRAAAGTLRGEAQQRAVAEFVATLPRSPTSAAPKADLGDGRNYYNAICSACHSGNGQGSAALAAPRLTGVDPAYLLRQMAAFRSGARGSHPADTYGAQMRRIVLALPAAGTDRDIVAYISSMPQDAARDAGP